jgi:hypothetical protein
MKFTIQKDLFLSKTKKFLSKGKINPLGKDSYQMQICRIITMDGEIMFAGKNVGSVLFCQTVMKADILEEGDVIIPDIVEIYDSVQDLLGDKITFNIGAEIFISDGKSEYTFGKGKVTANVKPLNDWIDCHVYVDNTIVYKDTEKPENTYKYIKWFNITAPVELVDVAKIIQKRVSSNLIKMVTKDNILIISAGNKQSNRNYKTLIDVESLINTEKDVANIFPVLANLSTKTEFMYHDLVSGKSRLWIKEGDTQWMIKFGERTEKEEVTSDESVGDLTA